MVADYKLQVGRIWLKYWLDLPQIHTLEISGSCSWHAATQHKGTRRSSTGKEFWAVELHHLPAPSHPNIRGSDLEGNHCYTWAVWPPYLNDLGRPCPNKMGLPPKNLPQLKAYAHAGPIDMPVSPLSLLCHLELQPRNSWHMGVQQPLPALDDRGILSVRSVGSAMSVLRLNWVEFDPWHPYISWLILINHQLLSR